MPGALRLEGIHYEEDVDWSLVYLAFEAELKLLRRPGMAASLQLAHDIARNWHPRRYGDFTGIAVAPRDSYVMRRRAAYQAVIGEIVVTAAFGTHEAWVPAGKTGLLGRRVASRSAERRGGKEGASTCRSRWGPYHSKKTTSKQET